MALPFVPIALFDKAIHYLFVKQMPSDRGCFKLKQYFNDTWLKGVNCMLIFNDIFLFFN